MVTQEVSLVTAKANSVGNRMFMATLDAGCPSARCARTRRPQLSTYALGYGHASLENAVTPLSFSLCFLFVSSISSSFLSLSTPLPPQVFPFLQLNTINDLHLRSIQTFCLHLSYSTPLRKTLTVNHYLRIKYFHQIGWKGGGWIAQSGLER